jgi:glycosyltransferase involved in cell wall biosynthesis
VEDGVSGLLAEPADTEQLAGAIVRLLRDPELRETLGRNARVRAVECFDVRKLAKRNAEFYEELIDGRV